MKSKVFLFVGIIMLIIAAGFIFYALNNPQGSFPWSNAITYTIYLFYLVIMVGFFILPMVVRKQGERKMKGVEQR